jgi:hypothetical protein
MNYPNPHGPSCPWHGITESWGAPNIKWCEETLCQWVSEPANTWSNLGYMIVGVYVFYLAIKNKESFDLKQYGPIIFFMGAMSLFYHLSNFYGSQILDFVGMFFFVGWVTGMNLIRLGKMKSSQLIPFNLVLGLSLTGLMHIMYLKGMKFQGIILLFAFVITFTEILAQRMKRTPIGWFLATLGSIIVAFGFSISDGTRFWCDPSQHGWFSQGHAMWHWTAAISMFTIYMHYTRPGMRKS